MAGDFSLTSLVLAIGLLAPPTTGSDAQPEDSLPIPLVTLNETTEWRYNETGQAMENTWAMSKHAVDFELWLRGTAPFGFEDSTLPIPTRTYLTRPSGQPPAVCTYYFETEFTFDTDPSESAELQLRHMIDDGAVIYLNGVELTRHHMPGNIGDPVTSSAQASAAVADAVFVGPIAVSAKPLVRGTNLLSVEVHQSEEEHPDLAMAVELTYLETKSTPSLKPLEVVILDRFARDDGPLEGQQTPVGKVTWSANPGFMIHSNRLHNESLAAGALVPFAAPTDIRYTIEVDVSHAVGEQDHATFLMLSNNLSDDIALAGKSDSNILALSFDKTGQISLWENSFKTLLFLQESETVVGKPAEATHLLLEIDPVKHTVRAEINAKEVAFITHPLQATPTRVGLGYFGLDAVSFDNFKVSQGTRPPWITNSIGMKLAAAAAGPFLMGSAKADSKVNEDETPQHTVTITRPYYIGIYEVTQSEYQQVMNHNPSYFSAAGKGKEEVIGLDTGRFPVERVKGNEAMEFCKNLSELPQEKAAGRVYRLPTEAEWEKACRAETDTPFHCGSSLTSYESNFNGNLPSAGATKGPFLTRTTTVGSYRPNAWGLYDMHGNVSEWCSDYYTANYYTTSPAEDPAGPVHGPGRVHRGGSWSSDANSCRTTYRDHVIDPYGYRTRGFRIVLSEWRELPLQPETKADQLEVAFQEKIRPYLAHYCLDCHSGEEPAGNLDLEPFQHAAEIATTSRKPWQQIHDRLLAGTMPPPEQDRPPFAETLFTRQWLDTALKTVELTGDPDPGHETIRRLNRSEYQNTIRDLLAIHFNTTELFPADDVAASGDALSLAPLQMEKYIHAAAQISSQAVLTVDGKPQTPEAYHKIFIATPGNKLPRVKATRQIITTLASRAYRRTTTEQERDRLVAIAENMYDESHSFEDSIGAALKAILLSPHFLFKVELDRYPDDPKAIRTLNGFELATRLSYFLWSSMPDDELTKHAKNGTIHDQLESQALRMLQDPKSEALTNDFAAHWLQLSKLKTVAPDRELFPDFDKSLQKAMQTETQMFLTAIIQEDRSLLDLLLSDFTFLDERLARHYDIPNIEGTEFRRVSLQGIPRGGLLTQASILTLTSNPDRTSPVKRGKWILENILGAPPPDPPPDVAELKIQNELAVALPLRKRLELHRENRTCAACHEKMDALGFAFENYDAIGRWRKKEANATIDVSGALPGGEQFDGPQGLNSLLRGPLRNEFARHITEKMLEYALGRELEYFDEPTILQITQALSKNDYRFSTLVVKIITSEPFLKRRGKRQRLL